MNTCSNLSARFIAAAAAGVMLMAAARTFAGGTPENAVLIIDPTDATSLYVGNYYKNARNIPDVNVFYIRSAGAPNYSSFMSTIQQGFTGTLHQRGIEDHADYVVLAPLNTFYVPTGFAVGSSCSIPQRVSLSAAFSLAPISGRYYGTFQWVPSGFGGNANNSYPSALPPLAFHAQTAYQFGSPSSDSNAQRMYIGAMLGYTGATGNTIPELLTMIDRSVSADGARPAGTFYFMNNVVDLRNVRACGVPNGNNTCPNPSIYINTASSIVSLGGSAQVLSGELPPPNTTNITGIMAGFALEDIPGAHLTLTHGAFADHLTSWAATFDTPGQTRASAWIAAGASGSEGTVEEPCADVTKFPSADFHRYYFQGMSLGESYLRSLVNVPFQSLLYGDPLTRPFAYIPTVSVSNTVGTKSGVITITPTATTANPGAAIASYSVLVDGVNMGNVSAGQSFSLDTQALNDGRHDLRVLAYDNTPIQNVGRWIGTLDTLNYGHASTLSVSPASGSLVQPFTFSYTATGGQVLEVHLVQNGRVLASSTGASGTMTVYGQNLGAGTSSIKVETWYSDGRIAWSSPVSVTVAATGTPAGATPVAYSYSKIVSTVNPYVVELPSSYDSDPGTVSYTLLNNPVQAGMVQNSGGPYIVIVPTPYAIGSETLQFQVHRGTSTSNVATVTLVYTSVKSIAGPTATSSTAGVAWNGTQPAGVAYVDGTPYASLWKNSTADSWINLTPSGAAFSSVYAANGGQIVGSATGSTEGGGYWTGTSPSWIDLTVPGSPSTIVNGVCGGQQVGYAMVGPNYDNHAFLWSGTAASRVDMTPAGSTNSGLMGTNGSYQIGWIDNHTAMWTGSPSSSFIVDPPGASSSWANAVDCAPPYEAVGAAIVNGERHGGYWTSSYIGPAGTWVDLNPVGATASEVKNAHNNVQVGWAMFGGNFHAGIWFGGDKSSWVDLNAALPPFYSGGSWASDIRTDADSNAAYILGRAWRADGSGSDLIIWKTPY